MKKNHLVFNSLIYTLYFILSCIVIMFAEMLVMRIVNLFIDPSPLTECVICALVYTVGINALLAIVSYKEGYGAGYYSWLGTLISGAVASLIHFIFALLFNFAAFSAGGVRFITALIKLGSSVRHNSFSEDIGAVEMIPFFFLNAVIYIGVMTAFGMIGAKRRISDRETLTGNKDNAQ